MSCAKDNRTICWDVHSTDIMCELPAHPGNWNFDVQVRVLFVCSVFGWERELCVSCLFVMSRLVRFRQGLCHCSLCHCSLNLCAICCTLCPGPALPCTQAVVLDPFGDTLHTRAPQCLTLSACVSAQLLCFTMHPCGAPERAARIPWLWCTSNQVTPSGATRKARRACHAA